MNEAALTDSCNHSSVLCFFVSVYCSFNFLHPSVQPTVPGDFTYIAVYCILQPVRLHAASLHQRGRRERGVCEKPGCTQIFCPKPFVCEILHRNTEIFALWLQGIRVGRPRNLFLLWLQKCVVCLVFVQPSLSYLVIRSWSDRWRFIRSVIERFLCEQFSIQPRYLVHCHSSGCTLWRY